MHPAYRLEKFIDDIGHTATKDSMAAEAIMKGFRATFESVVDEWDN